MKKLFVSGLLAISLLFAVLQSQAADTRSPKFNEYKVNTVYQGPAARLAIDSEDAAMFRTRLQDALSSPVNFAGEYVVTTWGCGTNCLYGGVVSKKTGKAVLFPWSACCWDGEGDMLYMRVNSRLFIIAGKLGEGDNVETGGIHGAHYYEFTGSVFKYIKSIAVPEAVYTDN